MVTSVKAVAMEAAREVATEARMMMAKTAPQRTAVAMVSMVSRAEVRADVRVVVTEAAVAFTLAATEARS